MPSTRAVANCCDWAITFSCLACVVVMFCLKLNCTFLRVFPCALLMGCWNCAPFLPTACLSIKHSLADTHNCTWVSWGSCIHHLKLDHEPLSPHFPSPSWGRNEKSDFFYNNTGVRMWVCLPPYKQSVEECAGTRKMLWTTAPCLSGSEPSCCSDPKSRNTFSWLWPC